MNFKTSLNDTVMKRIYYEFKTSLSYTVLKRTRTDICIVNTTYIYLYIYKCVILCMYNLEVPFIFPIVLY